MTDTTFQFEPLRFVGQLSPDSPDALEPYMTNAFGPLTAVQSELHWHVSDLCRFHQILYADLSRQTAAVDEQCAMLKAQVDAASKKLTDEEEDAFAVHVSRFRTAIMDKDKELDRVRRFADEFTVVGLWATAEQFLNRVFAELESATTGVDVQSVEAPFSWPNLSAAFTAKAIDLTLLNGYTDANECRVLNNTIKHAGHVNNRLAQFAYFAPHVGKRLTEIDFAMQRYLKGIFHFIGSLIEAANRQIDPSFPF